MELIADMLMIAGAAGVAVYCQILAGRHDGLARLVAAALAAAKGLFCLAAAILLFWMPVPRNRFLLRGLLHAGVLGGLFGAARIEPYGELEASAP